MTKGRDVHVVTTAFKGKQHAGAGARPSWCMSASQPEQGMKCLIMACALRVQPYLKEHLSFYFFYFFQVRQALNKKLCDLWKEFLSERRIGLAVKCKDGKQTGDGSNSHGFCGR